MVVLYLVVVAGNNANSLCQIEFATVKRTRDTHVQARVNLSAYLRDLIHERDLAATRSRLIFCEALPPTSASISGPHRKKQDCKY